MGWFSSLLGRKSSYEVSQAYSDLRSQVLALAETGLPGGEPPSGPLAVLVDVASKDHCYTFAAVADGTLSLYFSNGGGIIGAGETPKIGRAVGAFVKASESVAPALTAATEFPLPGAGVVALHLVKSGSVLRAEDSEDALGKGERPLSHWFHEIHRFIGLIRQVSELRENEPPLVFAAEMDMTKEASELLLAGADANMCSSEGKPVLGVACHAGSVGVAKLLLQAGAKVDASVPLQSGKEVSLSSAAVAADRAEVLALLVEAGADIEAKDASGLTPLHLASSLGHVDVVRKLLELGANIEARESTGYTPLMMAANAGQKEAAELLVHEGADANAEDHDESTPIMFAAQHGHVEIVQVWLAAKADPERRGKHGLSARDFAEQNGHDEVRALMTTSA